jgi:hypothetical protein
VPDVITPFTRAVNAITGRLPKRSTACTAVRAIINSTIIKKMKIIFSYTTKEAVADGTLVKIDQQYLDEAGIRTPVYLTRAVYQRYVEVPEELKGEQDEDGRLWDVLWMFRVYAGSKPDENTIRFKLSCRLPERTECLSNEVFEENEQARAVTLKAVCAANDIDDPQPAIFIMLPGED